jgi:GAF domain-containing protein
MVFTWSLNIHAGARSTAPRQPRRQSTAFGQGKTIAATHPLEDLDEDLWPLLGQLARALHLKNAELQPTLDAIVGNAVETIAPAEHAGLILLVDGRLVPQAVVGEPPHLLDLLQQKTGTGPCIEAARDQSVITIDNIVGESRWPMFAATAADLGVASMVCVPLWVNKLRLGTLSLYGDKPEAFESRHVQLTRLYATHAALALADAQRTAQLQAALMKRDIIGQAKGILMERDKITPDAAFECLSLASQRLNIKLTEIAQRLVETGELLS